MSTATLAARLSGLARITSTTAGAATANLSYTPHNATFREVVRGYLNYYLIARKNADIELAHLTCQVGQNFMAVITLNTECIRKALLYHTV